MNNLIFHLVLISISITLALYYNDYSLLLVSILFVYLLSRYSLKFVFLAFLISTIFIIYFNVNLQPIKPTSKVYTVIKVNKYSYYIKNNEATILLKTDVKLNKDDVIKINSPLKEVSALENFRLFSTVNYLRSNKIFYETYAKKVEIINKTKTKATPSKVNAYFDYLFFMQKDNIDDEVKTSLIELAVIHLVVVSGFHFNFFYKILNFVLDWIKIKFLKELIIFGILFYYLILLSFSYPAFRAFIALLLRISPLNNHLSNINQLALSAIIILLIFPLALLSYSFILTFIITLVITLIPKEISRNKIVNSFVIFLGTIPLIASMNFQISIISFLLQLVIAPFILLFYLFVLLGNYLTMFEGIALMLINSFEDVIKYINNYNIIIETGSYSLLFSIIYYLLFFTCLYFVKKNKFTLFLPFAFIVTTSYLPTFTGFVTFLNVGQADCIIIKPPFSSEAMMIDAPKPYQQNTVSNIIIPYLKAHKIKTIDTLVITHDDLDHSGGKDELIKNFDVKRVVDGKVKDIDFNNYKFIDLLANVKLKGENANSITLYSRINGLNYLFTGDIDAEAELEFNRYVKELPVDILKVAHHGSKTSTTNSFLDLTNPNIAIIQVKKDNHYNHPHPEVIKRLKERNISIYTTANNATITIYYNFFFNYIKTYK